MHLDKHSYLNRIFYARRGDGAKALVFNPRSGNRLIWLADIQRVLHQSGAQLSWDRLNDQACRWGARNALGAALFLLEALTGRSKPDWPHSRHGDRVSFVHDRLYARAVRGGPPGGFAALLKMDSQTQFRPIRILGFLRYMFPPAEYVRRRYACRGRPAVAVFALRHLVRCIVLDVLAPPVLLIAMLLARWLKRACCLRPWRPPSS